MRHQVALFRGINVGGHHKIPMAELRAAFEALGHQQVMSIIQSGNVCFASDDEPDRIMFAVRTAVKERFDVDVPVLLRTVDDIRATLAAHPFPRGEIEPKLHHIMFLTDAAPSDAHELIGDHTPSSEYEVIGHEIHVRYPQGSARASLTTTVVDRVLATTATARNLPTCDKILAALEGLASG